MAYSKQVAVFFKIWLLSCAKTVWEGFISFGINIFQDPLNEIKTLAKFSVLCALLFHGWVSVPEEGSP